MPENSLANFKHEPVCSKLGKSLSAVWQSMVFFLDTFLNLDNFSSLASFDVDPPLGLGDVAFLVIADLLDAQSVESLGQTPRALVSPHF